MFETLEDLNRTLPRPKMTGDPEHDRWVVERYMANGKMLRREAFACIGHSLAGVLDRAWHRLISLNPASHAPQA